MRSQRTTLLQAIKVAIDALCVLQQLIVATDFGYLAALHN